MFEWDGAKRDINLARHKLDFLDAPQLLDGRSAFTYPSPRGGKQRLVTVGLTGGKLHAVVWTARGEATRLISFRRASDAEERAYRARFS